MAKNTDFIGFTFNERHSSEFNIYSVSDGSRYQDSLIPSPIDYTEQIPGGVGQSYFGSDIDIKEFSLSIAYDKLTERQVRELRNWLAPDAIGELIFDERPYKTYTAKISTSPSLSFICFDTYNKETGKKERVYKGEGSINFICYYPLGVVSGEKKQLGWYREQIDDRIYRSIGGSSSIIDYKLENNEIAIFEKIEGNTLEIGSGDKSPDNPYNIVGSNPTKVTICGKNLLDISDFTVSYSDSYYIDKVTGFKLEAGCTYTISYNFNIKKASNPLRCDIGYGYNPKDALRKNIKVVQFPSGNQGKFSGTFTAPNDVNMYLVIRAARESGIASIEVNISDVQLEFGETATFYESSSKIDLNLPTLNYLYGTGNIRDEYDAATGVEIRRWGRVELDGTEAWSKNYPSNSDSWLYLIPGWVGDFSVIGTPMVCTHLPYKPTHPMAEIGISNPTASLFINFLDAIGTNDIPHLKAYLAAQAAAGTPVTVLYQLAEPVITKIEEILPFSNFLPSADSGLIINANPEYYNYFTDSNANISLRLYGAKYSNIDEWAASTGMLEDLSNPIEYNKFDSITGRYGARLYNPGDRETGFKIIFRKTNSELLEQKFWLENSISTTLNESSKNSFTISARSTSTEENIKLYGPVSEEEKFVANTAGYIEINTNNNTITFTYMGTDNEQKTIPAYFLLKKGFMFKIPVTTTGMMYAITEGISELQIDYNYLYY